LIGEAESRDALLLGRTPKITNHLVSPSLHETTLYEFDRLVEGAAGHGRTNG
jgi:hypothetical protein